MLLCNEPFASTNEREGSDIGRQVFVPLARAGVKVYIVTHLFDLAESLSVNNPGNVLFLRAPARTGPGPSGWSRAHPSPPPTARTSTRKSSGRPRPRGPKYRVMARAGSTEGRAPLGGSCPRGFWSRPGVSGRARGFLVAPGGSGRAPGYKGPRFVPRTSNRNQNRTKWTFWPRGMP